MQILDHKQFILLLGMLVLVCSSLFCSFSTVAQTYNIPNRYDFYFKSATNDYAPFMDYRWLKSQCYQESLLKPDAVSYVGAKGLCQFMDFTWAEVVRENKWPSWVSSFNPKLSIYAAAYYDAKLYRQWSSPRPYNDRINLMLASYNAGLGNILKAQRKCNGANPYNEIIACLEDITGVHSKETKTYVERINRYYIFLNTRGG